jgi:hypothetical protein
MKYLFTIVMLVLSLNLTAQKAYSLGLNTGFNVVQTEAGINKGVTTTLEASMINYQGLDFATQFTLGTGYSSYYSPDVRERLKGINTYAMLGFGDPDNLMLLFGAGYMSANSKSHLFTALEVRPFQFGENNEWNVILRGQIGGYLGIAPETEKDNSDIYTTLTMGVSYTINGINAK